MSSHREAPQISKDPVADSTDLYAFVSPDAPSTVTLIANYVPLEAPDGGPNFYEFGDDVLYQILIDNNGDAQPEIAYQFRFTTTVTIPGSFLYNDGPIQSLTDANWNRRQTYDVQRVDLPGGHVTVLGTNLPCPPCNVGPLSTPNYVANLANPAIHSVGNGIKVFAGQRAEGFYVDLGAIFDLGILRPFQQDHTNFGLSGTPIGTMAAGVNSTPTLNVHSIALQVPMNQLTSNGSTPTDPTNPVSVIGVWTTASRRKVRIFEGTPGNDVESGPWVQVSRLANPLVNEVIIPMSKKDLWNAEYPAGDSQFFSDFDNPLLAQLLPALYNAPSGTGANVFANLAAYNAANPVHRPDLDAVFLTGIPAGVVPGFQNFSTSVKADLLRLNMAYPPTTSNPSNLGVVGGDVAGWPNGRRVFDDVVTVAVRAMAGAILHLVVPSFTPDGAAGAVTPGLTTGPNDTTANHTENYLPNFPYLGTPHGGYYAPSINQ